MDTREELLAYIEQLEKQMQGAEVYGDSWWYDDWVARRSATAGEICTVLCVMAQAATKKQRFNRGSIGYRKTNARIKASRRRLRELAVVIDQPIEKYCPDKPLYLPKPSYIPDSVRNKRVAYRNAPTFAAFVN